MANMTGQKKIADQPSSDSASEANKQTGRRLTKNEKRRQREKSKSSDESTKNHVDNKTIPSENDELENITIEYISPNIDFEKIFGESNVLNEMKSIFMKFTKPEELLNASNTSGSEELIQANENNNNEKSANDQTNEKKISKKKLKLASRLTVAELKQLVPRPDVVEAHDVTSGDPRLLVLLKASRNTVPVPRHWCAKRKYLQGKRGIEKPPFQLPDFIAETGIAKIRESLIEQESLKKSKQKARDRVAPKMGRIDIDYQVLHDAFFKYQTKPKVTIHGDLYYEGKEFEVQVKDSKPGMLSAALREALGMSENSPPPYLVNMQRYGPPPSYPSLKIPGLNAPLPPGASFGYQTGGWGKAPVDEYGRPIYGDVFGVARQAADDRFNDANVDKKYRWGELLAVDKDAEENVDEDDEDSDEEQEEEQRQTKRVKPSGTSGTETPMTLDGLSSVSGAESSLASGTIDLRKRSGLETPDSFYAEAQPRDLYKVLAQKSSGQAGEVFSSERTYVFNEDNSENKPASSGLESVQNANDEQKKKRRLDSSASVQKLKDFKF